MVHNEKTITAGIKMLLKKNYSIEIALVDLKTEIDSSLTFEENWRHIKDKYVKPYLKKHLL